NQREAGAMVMPSSPLIAPNVQVLAELALSHRLPAITLFPDFARAGGLLAYGPNLLSLYGLAGVLSGKVARGAGPAAQPIQRPSEGPIRLHCRSNVRRNSRRCSTCEPRMLWEYPSLHRFYCAPTR